MTRVVVAGIGSEQRGDDGVGPAVARRVAAARGDLPWMPQEPLELLGTWDRAELAVLVDAVVAGGRPGTIRELELGPELPAPATVSSTHALGLVEVLRLARALGSAPRRVVLVGVEIAAGPEGMPETGTGLSPEVAGAVPEAARRVLALLGEVG